MFKIWLSAQSKDGERTQLGMIESDAKTLDEAKQEAYDQLWDMRLDSASCSPVYDWQEMYR